MMTNQPDTITPPPELVQQWYQEADNQLGPYYDYIAIQAARWAADQELEACCEWINREIGTGWGSGTKLRAARRPEPLSLKAQAHAELDRLIALIPTEGALAMAEPIRRALEQLDD